MSGSIIYYNDRDQRRSYGNLGRLFNRRAQVNGDHKSYSAWVLFLFESE